MFGGDNKKNQPPSQEDIENAEKMKLYELEALRASSARTRVVQKNETTKTYRRAEKQKNGKWSVIEIDIFDFNTAFGKAAASLDVENTAPKSKNMSAQSRPIEQSYKGEKVTEFPFAVAMQLLANLEYDVLKGDMGYSYTELDVDQNKLASDELKDMAAFAQTDYYDVEHFVSLSEREGLAWTEDLTVTLKKHHRLTAPGIYMISDVVRSNDALSRIDDAKDSKLAKAFKTVANRQSVKDMMVAMGVINDMNEFFAEFEKLVNSYGCIVENPNLHSDFNTKGKLKRCREICEDIHERAGLYVERYQTILDRIELSVNALKLDDFMTQLRNDPSLVEQLSYGIDTAQKRIDELVEKIGLNKNHETIMDMAINMEFLNTEISEYKKNRDAFTAKIQQNPSAAVEEKAGFADKPNVKRNKAPKN